MLSENRFHLLSKWLTFPLMSMFFLWWLFLFFLWCQDVLADNSCFCHLCRQVTLEFMMWPRNKMNRNMMLLLPDTKENRYQAADSAWSSGGINASFTTQTWNFFSSFIFYPLNHQWCFPKKACCCEGHFPIYAICKTAIMSSICYLPPCLRE